MGVGACLGGYCCGVVAVFLFFVYLKKNMLCDYLKCLLNFN